MIKFVKQDAWIGVYWNDSTIYLCLIPFFPLVIKRKAKRIEDCKDCHGNGGTVVCTRCGFCPGHCGCSEEDF